MQALESTRPSPQIVPLVLSGGAGTRLWPVSREALPKQFIGFASDRTLIQDTVLRCHGPGFSDAPIVVSLANQADLVTTQLAAIGINGTVVLEPARRDSCAAVLSGAWQAYQRDPESLVLVLAADHHISDADGFRAKVLEACRAAEQGYIVTFGIKPTRPATAYGYLLPGEPIAGTTCLKLARFREKPDMETAARFISEGCLWNSGNFLARSKDLVAAAKAVAPAIMRAAEQAAAKSTRDGPVIHLDRESYESSPRVSFDYAIMEKIANAAVIPVSYGWSDIGTWDSIADVMAMDNGNVTKGTASVLEGTGNLVFAQGVTAVVHGVDGLIVVATPDSVLVMKRGSSEHLKLVLSELEKSGKKVPA